MMLARDCPTCRQTFFLYLSQQTDGKGNARRFCSRACVERKDSLSAFGCIWCGEGLKRRSRKFCSHRCRADHQGAVRALNAKAMELRA